MRIYFVGPGGTRHLIAKQPPGFGTGGFYVEPFNYYIDPGPAALYKALRMGINPEKIKALIVTHHHLDHTGDMLAMIEAITKTEKKVPLITTSLVYEERIDDYHKNLVMYRHFSEWSRAIPVKHGTECFGVLLEEEKRLLYTSDTTYEKGMFPDVDAVIGNVVVFRDSQSGKHLSLDSFINLIQDTGAKIAFVAHFSPPLLYRLQEIKERIESETDAKAIIAREGLIYDL